jgi:hypothetical protein
VPSTLRATAPAHATGAVEFVALEDVAPDERFRLRPEGDVAALASSLGRLGQLVPVELRPLPAVEEGGPRWQVVAGFRRLAALRLLCRDRVLARLHAGLPDEEAWALALAQAVLGEPLRVAEIEALRARLEAEGTAPWADELLDEALARAPLDPELRERFFEFVKGPLAPVVERFGDEGGGEEAAGTATAPGTPTATGTGTETGTSIETGTGTETGTAIETGTGTGTGTETATATETGGGVRVEAGAEPGAVREEPVAAGTEDTSDVVEVDADELLRGLAVRLYEVNQDLAAAFASWGELPLEGRHAVLAQARYVAELFPFLLEGSRE